MSTHEQVWPSKKAKRNIFGLWDQTFTTLKIPTPSPIGGDDKDTDESTLQALHNEMVEWIVEFEEQKQAAFDPDDLQKPVVLKHFAKGPDVAKMSQVKSAEYDNNMLVKSEPSKVFHDVNGHAELILVRSYVAEVRKG
ncbi:hypothetical protein EDD18DRAFT_1098914 [Armillaria luteobubalina]|uniref:Uncharacterized protein n=1 Tax=Armillaria luteobubalina TaxID=153913 RepID=A0AA39QMB2_9AGAR|nr:hypothetical protein EDD18DRAFT_1098914 [Armillaria luteobubalina]